MMRYRRKRPMNTTPRIGGCRCIPMICGAMHIETMDLREWGEFRLDVDYITPGIGDAQ